MSTSKRKFIKKNNFIIHSFEFIGVPLQYTSITLTVWIDFRVGYRS